MTQIVVKSPEELEALGFEVEPPQTLLTDPLFAHYMKQLEALLERYPQIVANSFLTKWLALRNLTERRPWPHQLRYVALSSIRPRNLLAYEQGLAKTFIVALKIWLAYGEAFMQGRKVRKGSVQILAPAYALGDLCWQGELSYAGLADFVDVITNEKELRSATKPIWVMTYDFLKQETSKGQAMRKHNRGRKVSGAFYGYPMWKLVRRLAKANYAVVDEIHYLRDGTARMQAVQHWIRGVPKRDGLSGTPMDGWPSHLSAIFKVLYGEKSVAFPMTAKEFNTLFIREQVVSTDLVTGEESAGLAKRRTVPGVAQDMLPTFDARTRHLTHRLRVTDPECRGYVKFPNAHYHKVVLDLTPKHEAFYLRINSMVMQEIREITQRAAQEQQETGAIRNRRALENNVLSKLQLLRRAASAPWGMAEFGWDLPAHEAIKLPALANICSQAVMEGRKFIIFTNQIPAGKVIVDYLREMGIATVRVYATDPTEPKKEFTRTDREAALAAFLNDPEVHGLVANIGLVATALTLVVASVLIHFDHDWKGNVYVQANSRAIRPGNPRDVDVHDLVVRRTSEVYVYKFQRGKIRANAEAIDREFDDFVPGVQSEQDGPQDAYQAATAMLVNDRPDDSEED